MRIPGWLFIVGVIAAIGATALCSVVSFLGARQVALDAGEAGIQVVSFADFFREQPTPIPTRAPVISTALPTATTAADLTAATVTNPTPTGPVPTLDPLADYQWNDPRQVRILLLGIVLRGGGVVLLWAVREPGAWTWRQILAGRSPGAARHA